jgi:hypothetical protein
MLNKVGRVLLMAILCVLLVGFGVCGAAGVMWAFQGGIMPLAFGLAGLGIAWLCWSLLAKQWRKARPPKG